MSIKADWFKPLSNDKLRELASRLGEAYKNEKVLQELPPDLLSYITTENTSHRKPQYMIDQQNAGVKSYFHDGKEHWGMGNVSTRIGRCLSLINQEVICRFYANKLN